jgi:hypothetical protein
MEFILSIWLILTYTKKAKLIGFKERKFVGATFLRRWNVFDGNWATQSGIHFEIKAFSHTETVLIKSKQFNRWILQWIFSIHQWKFAFYKIMYIEYLIEEESKKDNS